MEITDIAGYRVIRQLGAGGMGQVFLVQHPRLPRQDALKLLDAGVSRNDEFKVRFQREADLLAQLSHQNIVTLHDRGEFEGRLWITMEYVDGTDAGELLKADGPLDPGLAVQLVGAAAAALDYAWRKQKVTHRDVKPANILVGIDESDGAPQIESVKLADFGIAKAAGEATSLTSTGMTIGTMQYISPEAIEGEEVDNRSDLYSLGCTAFHLLTGQPPFTGTSIASTMSAHLNKPVPSISTVNPHLPSAMDAVFERVLAKKPDGRYPSCAAFITALQEAAGGEVRYPASAQTLAAARSPNRGVVDPDAPTNVRKTSEGEGAPPQRRSRTVPILAAVVAVLAIGAAVLGVSATRGDNDESVAPTTGTTTTTVPSTTTLSVVPAPPPPVVTTPPETTTSVPTVTTTVASPPLPYEGMPCTVSEYGAVSADGNLACSPLTGAWRDQTHLRRPAVQLGTACTEPGARARVAQTDGLATCKVDPTGDLVWSW
ncbi:serine/threonine protein kinase [Mycobacterium sp. IS-1496]|uniref:serine/threonine-protein kinase n=1 Tax=Mycobacterium sp. IS-1496 TaxID=1772284 RepID=UPI0007417467|nr:serine/threonine-protein kinase [Mycobacterium sp. IS-1496]KUI21977.1 serine/threonine protein kinase [Mycobacterium sp. IS-1496]